MQKERSFRDSNLKDLNRSKLIFPVLVFANVNNLQEVNLEKAVPGQHTSISSERSIIWIISKNQMLR